MAVSFCPTRNVFKQKCVKFDSQTLILSSMRPISAKLNVYIYSKPYDTYVMAHRFLPTTNFITSNNSDVVESSVVVHAAVLECATEYIRMYMSYRVSVGVTQLKCVKHFLNNQ